jgi:hypothetical protein
VPLKELVSAGGRWLLRCSPIRSSATAWSLWVGDHQMLVADACSG